MQKFPGQGSNPRHSRDQSHSSDKARSLTYCTTREFQSFSDFKTVGNLGSQEQVMGVPAVVQQGKKKKSYSHLDFPGMGKPSVVLKRLSPF